MAAPAYYPAALRAEFVELPEALVTFFKQRGDYYLPLPGRDPHMRAVTYRTIVGKNAQEIPAEYANTFELVTKFDSYPFENLDPTSADEAHESAVAACKFLFGSNHFRITEKAYMINTSSLPVRVSYDINGHPATQPLYVKKPDTNRLIGKFMYDIISGLGSTLYCFNRAVFIEQGIAGTLLWHLDEKKIIDDPTYRVGLARAAVHGQVLGTPDVVNSRNRIVDGKRRTRLFDFNLLFTAPQEPVDPNFLLRPYLQNDPKFMCMTYAKNKMVAKAYTEECYAVGTRIENQHKAFFNLCRIAGQLRDQTRLTLDQRVHNWYGARSFEQYFEHKLKDLLAMAP